MGQSTYQVDGGRSPTKLNPERGTLANFRGNTQPSAAQLDDLPNQSQSKASTFTSLLPAGLGLVEGGFKRTRQRINLKRKL